MSPHPAPALHSQGAASSAFEFKVPFPGEAGHPKHSYCCIISHAVFDKPRMLSYLAHPQPISQPTPPFIFTILREPVSQFVSAVRYHRWPKPWVRRNATCTRSWIEVLDWAYRSRQPTLEAPKGYFVESQALDLGWVAYYKQHAERREPSKVSSSRGPTTLSWESEALMDRWIRRLRDEIDLVMVMEHFDESLVRLSALLLRYALHVAFPIYDCATPGCSS
jgi:hypothetical protein